jgi:hypothetical protein
MFRRTDCGEFFISRHSYDSPGRLLLPPFQTAAERRLSTDSYDDRRY